MITFDQTKSLLLVGGVLYAIYQVNKLKNATVEFVTEDINPASDQNFIYTAVSDLTESITGVPDDDLGSAIYRAIHE